MIKTTTTEVYEDNAGTLHLFRTTQDGTIDYASTYYGNPEDCAADFAAIACAGADPVADRWESVDLDEAQADYDMLTNLVASTDWYEGTDSDMVDEDQSGYAAKAFVDAYLGTDAE